MAARALIAILAGSLALSPVAAGAEGWTRTYTTDEVAADLAYGFCPLYLADQFPLTGNPRLTERGFGGKVINTVEPRFGQIAQVSRLTTDARLAFGGIAGKVCSVTITGKDLDKIYARLVRDKKLTGIAFAAAPRQSGQKGAALIEAYKALVEGQVLNLQLIRMKQPTPTIVVQLFGTAN